MLYLLGSVVKVMLPFDPAIRYIAAVGNVSEGLCWEMEGGPWIEANRRFLKPTRRLIEDVAEEISRLTGAGKGKIAELLRSRLRHFLSSPKGNITSDRFLYVEIHGNQYCFWSYEDMWTFDAVSGRPEAGTYYVVGGGTLNAFFMRRMVKERVVGETELHFFPPINEVVRVERAKGIEWSLLVGEWYSYAYREITKDTVVITPIWRDFKLDIWSHCLERYGKCSLAFNEFEVVELHGEEEREEDEDKHDAPGPLSLEDIEA